jgi:ATP-dependent RNA helicase DDX3X
MSSFETGDMIQALKESSNGTAANGPNRRTAEELQQAGWVVPQKYDYEAAEAQAAPAAADGGEPFGHGGSLPEWAHNAARYEWNADFGDVAPRIPELEQQLFHNEFTNRAGGKIEKSVTVALPLSPCFADESQPPCYQGRC